MSETATQAAGVSGIVFTAGDNVYPDGSAANFNNCYGPSWGALKSRTRPGVGNHEYANNPGAAAYFSYFGDSAGKAGDGWYDYEAGTWRIYALNSECKGAQCSAQYAWLKANLAAEPHRCVLAIWHRPPLSTGPHGNSPLLANVFKLLYANGADVLVNGHDHMYERFAPFNPSLASDPQRGLREFVVGTGGGGLYSYVSDSSLLEVRNNTSHGVLRFDLAPGAYSWQFIPAGGATFTDSGTASCH